MTCKEYWNNIVCELNKKSLPIRSFGFGDLYPEVQYVTLDALRPDDWPNGIAENSVYVTFGIDMAMMTVECASCGHIWLTDEDKRKSYLAMCSIKKAHKAIGKTWMRKSKFKNTEDLAKKIDKFWSSVLETLDEVTGGYPYKEMKINIY